jgi:Peptidase family C25
MRGVDKLIVTNVSELRRKYGARGYGRVLKAVQKLMAADAKRGVRTQLLALDSRAAMKKLRGKAVTNANGPRQYKEAIDAAYRAASPDYLMILGATDVVPQQDLANPVYAPGEDDDQLAWSDLPYACEAPYSRRIGDFRAPTRVVGRLPDKFAGDDPSYLETLLETAATFELAPRKRFDAYLGISAAVWKSSTALSLRNTFGSDRALQSVPTKSPRWPASLLRSRMHFINCHGSPADPHFYGQKGKSNFPIAHDARYLASRIARGTIVAAECCYGAEMYDASLSDGQTGICTTYLGAGAYGFFGSSTIAYGPSSGNAEADVICQVFLQRVLRGSSLGRAALEARQQFIATAGTLEPTELKTLAQFSLLGDPSVHAVEVDAPALTMTRAFRSAVPDRKRADRGLRRRQLAKTGLALESTIGAARRVSEDEPTGKPRNALERAARESGVRAKHWVSFKVDDPGAKLLRGAKIARPGPSEFHVLVGSRKLPSEKRNRPIPGVRQVIVLTAAVQDGEVVHLRRSHAKMRHGVARKGRP